jgi:bloom syndrome protein
MDQKEKFTAMGISTEFIGDDSCALDLVLSGNVQIVFISPESLLNTKYRNMILSTVYKEKLVPVGVDEAHCIKTW